MQMRPVYVVLADKPRNIDQKPAYGGVAAILKIMNTPAGVGKEFFEVLRIGRTDIELHIRHQGQFGINALNEWSGTLEFSVEDMCINKQPEGAMKDHIRFK